MEVSFIELSIIMQLDEILLVEFGKRVMDHGRAMMVLYHCTEGKVYLLMDITYQS